MLYPSLYSTYPIEEVIPNPIKAKLPSPRSELDLPI
jgi:hypothetical protein